MKITNYNDILKWSHTLLNCDLETAFKFSVGFKSLDCSSAILFNCDSSILLT